ncbi:MAG: ester cyclase [Dehalococcoidia bacterium]|jgi:steroid delta-isomerase-like uncharacterized protein
MGIEENKRLIRRYFEEAFNTGEDVRFDEFFSADFIDHDSFPGQVAGPDGVREAYRSWRQSFPDTRGTINDIIAEKDRVAVRTTLEATHLGAFSGIAPTHKQIKLGAVSIFRIVGGKIVERWGLTEGFKLKEQLA